MITMDELIRLLWGHNINVDRIKEEKLTRIAARASGEN